MGAELQQIEQRDRTVAADPAPAKNVSTCAAGGHKPFCTFISRFPSSLADRLTATAARHILTC